MKESKITAILQSLASGEGDLETLVDAVDEAQEDDSSPAAPPPEQVQAADRPAQNEHYICELAQRLERLRAYIVRLPVWREKVQLRQRRLERWTHARKHTVVPLSPGATIATELTKAAAMKIQVSPRSLSACR